MPTTNYFDASFGVRSIGDRTDNIGTPITDLSAEEDRYPASLYSEGVLKPFDAYVPVAGAAASMNVIIGSGTTKTDYFVVEGEDPGQGNYIVRMGAATETVALDAADGSNPRIDEIYLVVQDDAYDASGNGLARLAYRKGDAAASPTAPGEDAGWDAAALIVTINVPAAATDILACTLTDGRSQSTVGASSGGFAPTGSVMAFAGPSAPAGYLLAEGTAVSRTVYAALFKVIGTSFGAGDGSTTFNLPDLRQRFALGKAAAGTGSVLGATGGAIDHVHSNPNTGADGGHSHSFSDTATTGAGGTHTHAVNPPSTTTVSSGSHTHTGTTTAGETKFGDSVNGTLVDSDGAHTHTVDIASFTSGSSTTHTHSVSVSGVTGAEADHTHTQADTGANNPPYQVLNHIIKT